MDANLIKGIIRWTDGLEGAEEAGRHFESALDQQLSYHDEKTARLLLIGTTAVQYSAGLDEGELQPHLHEALEDFNELVEEDSVNDFAFFNGPMGDIERIPVRTTLEQLDALNAMIAQNLAEADEIDEAVEFLDGKIRSLLRLRNPPVLHMLTSQARRFMERAARESPDDPAETASFRLAVECARTATQVSDFYEDSPIALKQVEWARELLRRAAADENARTDTTSQNQSSSKCFVASAAFGPGHPLVAALRSWRDDRLRRSITGRFLLFLYEWCSPPVACYIAKRPRVQAVARRVIIAMTRPFLSVP